MYDIDSWVTQHINVTERNTPQIIAHCPLHDDKHPSLSINTEKSVWKCHAGCGDGTLAQLAERMGVPPPQTSQNETCYNYKNEHDELVYQVVRKQPKNFYCRQPDGSGGWINNIKGITPIPYRLPELIQSNKDPILIVEGEKSVDRLMQHGYTATCNHGGADKWKDIHSKWIPPGKKVVIIPDCDIPGEKHAAKVKATLPDHEVYTFNLGYEVTKDHGKDVDDYLDQHGEEKFIEEIINLIGTPPDPRKEPPDTTKAGESFARNSMPPPLKLAQEAFHGPVGDIVKVIMPHTESDEAALLLTLLTTMGNLIGRRPYFLVEATHHYPNLFVLLVGETSRARKGTAQGWANYIAQQIYPQWHPHNGLSSGEGLIAQVRDPDEDEQPPAESAYRSLRLDKPLFIIEEEFGAVLKRMKWKDNTLSPIIRSAWDSKPLETLVKKNPMRASHAHISIVGHITKDELKKLLEEVDIANGLINRFIICYIRRSKELPNGGDLGRVKAYLQQPIRELQEILAWIEKADECVVDRRSDTNKQWATAYSKLTADRPGKWGLATARAEAQVLRLSMLYSLLDQTPVIEPVHLEAALAVWDYIDASTKFVLGDSSEHQLAVKILQALKHSQDGLSRSDISTQVCQGHYSKDLIDEALSHLQANQLAQLTEQTTRGRSKQIWTANDSQY